MPRRPRRRWERSDAMERRIKVAALVELGLAQKQIAARLGVTTRTVRNALAYWRGRGAA